MKTWKGQANALCHRDYTTGTSVQVNVYMDFIEIVSPGLFPEGDSPDRHLEGSGGDSKQRNPSIAQVLFGSGMIEQYGTGIPRIKRARDAAGVAFSYRQDVNSTVIRFERPGTQTSDAAAISSTDAASPRFPRKTQRNREGRHADCARLGLRGEKRAHGANGGREGKGDGDPEAPCRKRTSRMGRIKPARPKAVLSSKREVSACPLLPATARYCPRHSTSLPNAAGMSRYLFCRDENAGKNERSALLDASRFRKPTRARKASLNVTN